MLIRTQLSSEDENEDETRMESDVEGFVLYRKSATPTGSKDDVFVCILLVHSKEGYANLHIAIKWG